MFEGQICIQLLLDGNNIRGSLHEVHWLGEEHVRHVDAHPIHRPFERVILGPHDRQLFWDNPLQLKQLISHWIQLFKGFLK